MGTGGQGCVKRDGGPGKKKKRERPEISFVLTWGVVTLETNLVSIEERTYLQ